MRTLLILSLAAIITLAACSPEDAFPSPPPPAQMPTSKSDMPESVKQAIRADVAAGMTVTHVISTGGTGAYAVRNGGTIALTDPKTHIIKTYRVEPAWADAALEFLKDFE